MGLKRAIKKLDTAISKVLNGTVRKVLDADELLDDILWHWPNVGPVLDMMEEQGLIPSASAAAADFAYAKSQGVDEYSLEQEFSSLVGDWIRNSAVPFRTLVEGRVGTPPYTVEYWTLEIESERQFSTFGQAAAFAEHHVARYGEDSGADVLDSNGQEVWGA